MSNAVKDTPTPPNDEVNLQALAGLLHDIGKFAVRAGEKGSLPVLDPLVKSSYGQYHALLSADAIDKYVPSAWAKRVKQLAGNHHRPQADDPAQAIITLADHLSAGERDDTNDDDQRHTQPRQLRSIFAGLYADGATGKDLYWPLRPLSVEQADGQAPAIFPAAALPQAETWAQYETLWRDFCVQWSQLKQAHEPNGDLASYVESLLWLMQRYTTAMPSAYYGSVPDISLYDHSRMTGALAAVMAGLDTAQVTQLSSKNVDLKQAPPPPIALLVGGDLSGIQDFIYTITARGAASALRGRSFYLQLLTEAVMRYVLRELKLPITNVVYAGGGKFYLLARVSDAATIAQLQQAISRVLLRHHGGDLYLSLQAVSLQAQDFFGGKLSEKWGELSGHMQSKKWSRFNELPSADLQTLFAPQGNGGNEDKQCQVCGAEDIRTEAVDETGNNPEGIRKCAQCRAFEDLGDSLRHADALIFDWVTPSTSDNTRGKVNEVLLSFGLQAKTWSWHIDEGNNLSKLLPPKTGQRRSLFALNDETLQRIGFKPSTFVAVGQRFIANVTPTQWYGEKETVKPFDMLEAQSNGIKRLGMLMMDVDELGMIFSKGLKEKATLSRLAHLSFAINLFFEGYVPTLARQIDREDRLYSIYAGGDDLFFVGAWDAVIELAQQIRAALDDYSGHHACIHASAAIVLTSGKYPLYRAAQDLKEAEQQAKGLIWYDETGTQRKKDALSFLGQALPWRRIGYQNIAAGGGNAAAVKQLLRQLENDMGNKSLIRKLAEFYAQYAEVNHQRELAGQSKQMFGPWHYRAAYAFARLAYGKHKEAVQQAAQAIMADDFRGIEWVGMAARWAELEVRVPREE